MFRIQKQFALVIYILFRNFVTIVLYEEFWNLNQREVLTL